MDVQQDFANPNQPSTYGQVRSMPELFEQLIRRSTMKKVSKLKEFFKSCLALIHDKYVVSKLTTLIEETTEDL